MLCWIRTQELSSHTSVFWLNHHTYTSIRIKLRQRFQYNFASYSCWQRQWKESWGTFFLSLSEEYSFKHTHPKRKRYWTISASISLIRCQYHKETILCYWSCVRLYFCISSLERIPLSVDYTVASQAKNNGKVTWGTQSQTQLKLPPC